MGPKFGFSQHQALEQPWGYIEIQAFAFGIKIA